MRTGKGGRVDLPYGYPCSQQPQSGPGTTTRNKPKTRRLVGSDEQTLTVGLGGDYGFVQQSRTDGNSPYLVAVRPGERPLSASETPYATGAGMNNTSPRQLDYLGGAHGEAF
jgi:hypothetical protein